MRFQRLNPYLVPMTRSGNQEKNKNNLSFLPARQIIYVLKSFNFLLFLKIFFNAISNYQDIFKKLMLWGKINNKTAAFYSLFVSFIENYNFFGF